MSYPSSFSLTDSLIFTGEAFIEGHALIVEEGKITDLCPNAKVPSSFETISIPHSILTSGYIDCQVNGGGNVLFNNTPTRDGVLQIAAAHRKTGTTSLLPTCITDKPEIFSQAIHACREARQKDSGILGIHLEGPHISAEGRYKGTHNPAFVRPLTQADIALYRPDLDEKILLTIAPETVSAQDIAKLAAQGTLISLGHSDATLEQTEAAIKAGASCFTHLFNGMPPISSRTPNITLAGLESPIAYANFIADNIHLTSELVRVMVRAKAPDKLFMISDAAAPAGAETPAPFEWNGVKVWPEKDRLINERGGLAGAMLTLGECVPVMIRDARLDPERVLRMASTIPAEFLGLGDRLGKLLPGYQADILALDHAFKTECVWKCGSNCA